MLYGYHSHKRDVTYTFERPVTFQHRRRPQPVLGGSTATNRGCFVLQAKKLRANAGTQVFDKA